MNGETDIHVCERNDKQYVLVVFNADSTNSEMLDCHCRNGAVKIRVFIEENEPTAIRFTGKWQDIHDVLNEFGGSDIVDVNSSAKKLAIVMLNEYKKMMVLGDEIIRDALQ